MTYSGTVRNGVVVLDTDAPPPDGARARVEIGTDAVKAQAAPAGESLSEFLLRFAGRAEGLPADLAAEHDHYLHGTPKRSDE